MAFKFRFERLLKLKKMTEDEKQREYYHAMMDYNRLMKELLELKNRRDDAILRRKSLEKSGSRGAFFDVIDNFLEGNKKNCIEKIAQIKEKRSHMDEKLEELSVATKEKKIYERLKEKALHSYKLDQEMKEIRNLDEYLTQYAQRR